KGTALQNTGKLQEAIDCYEQSILHRHNQPWPHINLSIIHRDLGNNSKAIDYATKATEGWPETGEAYYFLGLALEADGKNKKSKEAFDKAKSLGCNA
ncbi:hypothetical protein C6A37_07675, partial [Desulfobacteraceae bacterium SEEP-SAG9]